MAKVTLLLDGKQHEIEVKPNEKILDVALRRGLDAPFSCRSAICSTCMAKLVSGTVQMEQNHVLTDGELEEGFIVLCQALPTSDEVVITYDY